MLLRGLSSSIHSAGPDSPSERAGGFLQSLGTLVICSAHSLCSFEGRMLGRMAHEYGERGTVALLGLLLNPTKRLLLACSQPLDI